VSCAGERHARREGREIVMATTAADVSLDALCDLGVEVILGFLGDGINDLMESLRMRQDLDYGSDAC
jgi:hypothetical protein